MKIYLAGPEVFLPQAQAILEQKINLCAQRGCLGISPFDNAIALEHSHPKASAQIIFEQNIALINQSDAVIANITPFRGPHMDPGTAFEIGYAFALGKKIICYTQDARDLIDRVGQGSDRPMLWGTPNHPLDRPLDAQGYLVEDFGLSENLMIAAPCQILSLGLPPHKHFVSLEGFEQALSALFKTV